MIYQLFFERRPDGLYNVVCNDEFTVACPHDDLLTDVGAALLMFADDDIAGVRVGYAYEPGRVNIHADGGCIWTREERAQEVIDWLNSQLLGAEA